MVSAVSTSALALRIGASESDMTWPMPPAGRARSDRELVESTSGREIDQETYDRFSSPLDVQIVDEGRVGTRPAEARRPARDRARVLASIRLANGDTGYVELSPAGQRRLSALGAGAVTGFDNADVVERHRHPRGIKWMSLNRLMRLREEETAEQRPRRTPGPGVAGDALRSSRRLLEPLHAVPVVSRRRVMVAFVLDMNDQPWRWEESEEELEERLRRYDEVLYQQHMQDLKNMEEAAERLGGEDGNRLKA